MESPRQTQQLKPSQSKSLLEAQLQLIQLRLDDHHPEQAYQMIRPLLEEFPKKVDVLNMAGLIQLSLGNSDQSRQYFLRALKVRQSPSLILNLSSSLMSGKRYRQAESLLRKYYPIFAKYRYLERYWHNRGLALYHQHKKTAAMHLFRKALQENPAFVLTLNQLGDIYASVGKVGKAMAFFKKSMRYCRECLYPVEKAAQLYLQHGHVAKAYATLKRFRETGGADVPIGNQFQRLWTLARTRLQEERRLGARQKM
ncbi:MAG: tetratricopeptide repeat protein [Zetaproteobacteria bacterium]|nr:tetratricopeptide repeat protein [Zetaproteobacteria bacterium]